MQTRIIYPCGIRNEEEYQLMCKADELFDKMLDRWYEETSTYEMPLDELNELYRSAYAKLNLLWLYNRISY